ncbi:rhodanese-like domain-containing protein [Vogesella sp. EB]|uniref:rhodanese-like domain-containing protein n=1 Tax=Vogesella sp. EB TaxID=1526735 RepID=UPI00069DF3C8|nr:rhodanese-like domain-containing protein [Vogesella sp. EB]
MKLLVRSVLALACSLWLGSALADALLIDVRSPEEYAQRHLPGATLLPLDRIGSEIQQLAPDKNTPIQLYCRTGNRSAMALQQLQQLGYRQVRNLGGIDAAAATLQLTPQP